MIIVSDASPVIALAVCDKLDLLDKLFDKVCIPQAVFNELIVPYKPNVKMISEWAKNRIVPVKNVAAAAAFSQNLDLGESEALSLYWELAGKPETTGFEAGNNRIKVSNNALTVCRNKNSKGSGYTEAEIQSK